MKIVRYEHELDPAFKRSQVVIYADLLASHEPIVLCRLRSMLTASRSMRKVVIRAYLWLKLCRGSCVSAQSIAYRELYTSI